MSVSDFLLRFENLFTKKSCQKWFHLKPKVFLIIKLVISNTCSKSNSEIFCKMQFLILFFFQQVCKNLNKLFYKMQNLFWFFQQVCKSFHKIFVCVASFFVVIRNQMQKSNFLFLMHLRKFNIKNLLNFFLYW